MRKSRFTEEQIIGVLREQEAESPTAKVCWRHGISEQTFCRWKSKYGGMGPSSASTPARCSIVKLFQKLGGFVRTEIRIEPLCGAVKHCDTPLVCGDASKPEGPLPNSGGLGRAVAVSEPGSLFLFLLGLGVVVVLSFGRGLRRSMPGLS